MTSLVLDVIYIVNNASLGCVNEAAVNCYGLITLKGEHSSEVKEMYNKIRKAYELEECYLALEEYETRAQEGKDDILLLRKHILDQIHALVD